MTAQKAENVNVSDHAQQALQGVMAAGLTSPSGHSPREPRKKRRKEHGEHGDREEVPAKTTKKPAAGSAAHPKKWGTHFITDYDGIEICFKYAKGAPGACSEPCPSQRSHSCQHCLGRHTNDLCPTHVKKDGKGNTKGNSPKKSPGK